MKKVYFNFVLPVSIILCLAFIIQRPNPVLVKHKQKSNLFYSPFQDDNWLKVKNGIHLSPAALLSYGKAELGLNDQDELRLLKTQTDPIGFTHHRYQQSFNGIKVEGAQLLIHEKDGNVQTLNGRLIKNLWLNTQPDISKEKALQIALDHIQADKYMWEDKEAEALLKSIKKDIEATFYPDVELVIADKNYLQNSKDYRLVYKLTIYAAEPHSKTMLFVDAANGSIYHELNVLHTQDTEEINNTIGTAITKYNGKQEIVTDSFRADGYRLYETTRGDGIETRNMLQQTSIEEAIDFEDEDNYWDNINEFSDEAATDAHWGAEMTYDYLKVIHDYNSYDNKGAKITCLVHFDEKMDNASWNGAWANFGDGNGITYSPWVSLDVVGHEIMHGVTQETANLIYQFEPGALNESFSDIFGAAVEFWASPGSADWLVGEDSHINGNGIRDMKNPKSDSNPDTYKGEYWVTGLFDNGGVHYNSGVQNQWFYLLCEGGNGQNDNNENYSVTGIGLNKGSEIAFRNLSYYLTETSQYGDARQGSLQAAEDLYGLCSEEYLSVLDAWFAVGVGSKDQAWDVSISEIVYPQPFNCSSQTNQYITIQLRYNGCGSFIPGGTKIPVAYAVSNQDTVHEEAVLLYDLDGGETFDYTFENPTADFGLFDPLPLVCFVELEQDMDRYNDTLWTEATFILEQSFDFGMAEVIRPTSQCIDDQQALEVAVQYMGCDEFAAGVELNLSYQLNEGEKVTETTTTPKSLNTGDTFNYTFNQTISLDKPGTHILNFEVDYAPDFVSLNNTIEGYSFLNPVDIDQETLITFEDNTAVTDSFFVITGPEAGVMVDKKGSNTGSGEYGLMMVGGNMVGKFYQGELEIPNGQNNWAINEGFSSKVCFCLDASNMSNLQLEFDLRQEISELYADYQGEDLYDASSMRLLVDGTQISDTYIPETRNEDPWTTHLISLKDYASSNFELCFESRNFLYPPALPPFIQVEDGDYTFLDNIKITGVATDIQTVDTGLQLKVYPNPAKGIFNLQIPRNIKLLKVYDIQGRLIKTLSNNIHQQYRQLDLQSYPNGIYFLQTDEDEWVKLFKM